MLFEKRIEHRTEPKRSIPEMWAEYCQLLQATKRFGVARLLNWMQSDMGNGTLNFVTAPASTRFHGSYPGGLLEHTLNVYHRAYALLAYELRQETEEVQHSDAVAAMLESLTIVALLHDLCKVGFYTEEWRNKKIYSENGSKQDPGGRFDRETIREYRVLDTHKFGHGAASIEIAERFMGINGLTEEEKYAIRYHMGDFTNERETGEVYNRYPLATLLHMADIGATYLDERECDESTDAFWANRNACARPAKKEPAPAPGENGDTKTGEQAE